MAVFKGSEMQIPRKKDDRDILLLFFKLEILTLKRGSVFFGRDRNCYPWKIPLGVLEKGCLKPLIVFLGIKLWLSLGLLLPRLV